MSTKWEVSIIPGMKVWTGADRNHQWTVTSVDLSEQYGIHYVDANGKAVVGGDDEAHFRNYRIPVDAPAEKRARALAPGWSEWEGHGCNPCYLASVANWREVGRYAKGEVGSRVGYCEPCATKAGAFLDAHAAPPATAKARPADDDRAAWKAFLPTAKLPDSGTKTFNVGEVWAFATMDSTGAVGLVINLLSDGCRVKWLAGMGAGAEDNVTSTPWLLRCKRLFPAPPVEAAKARENDASAQGGKPKPPEKAKREWKAPREMVGGEFREEVAGRVFRASTDNRAREVMLCNLLNERPPARSINTRGVRSIYLPPTESQGERLAKLVESGVRADGRLDETGYQATVRGWRHG